MTVKENSFPVPLVPSQGIDFSGAFTAMEKQRIKGCERCKKPFDPCDLTQSVLSFPHLCDDCALEEGDDFVRSIGQGLLHNGA